MKRCYVCEEVKPLDEFYAQPTSKDGRASKCKNCHKKAMADNRRDNPAVRERDRERAKRPDRIAHSKRNTQRWRQENPDAYRAQNAVNNALRDGRISKEPCAICGSTDGVHAHHKDYARPLDVVWLCARCHHRLHKIFPEFEAQTKRRHER